MYNKNLNIKSEDTELIESFLKGNHAAFNILVRKYQERIYYTIRRMVLNHDDADDLTQEVFIKIFNSLGEFRGESKFFTYLYRIAVNYSLNHLNRNKKTASKTVDAETREIESSDLRADESIDSEEKSRLLVEAIESLPAQQRAVFNMRYYDNLSYDEISGILNKSSGGMKANYFHALKNIRKFLKSSKMSELLGQN